MIWDHVDQKDDNGVDNKPSSPVCGEVPCFREFWDSCLGGRPRWAAHSLGGAGGMCFPGCLGKAWPQASSPFFCQSRKLPWTPKPGTGRHGHRVPETRHLYEPFISRVGFIQTCKIQMQGSLSASVPVSTERMLLRRTQALTCHCDGPSLGRALLARKKLRGCYRALAGTHCLSNLNSSPKVTFILNKDTKIINFLV